MSPLSFVQFIFNIGEKIRRSVFGGAFKTTQNCARLTHSFIAEFAVLKIDDRYVFRLYISLNILKLETTEWYFPAMTRFDMSSLLTRLVEDIIRSDRNTFFLVVRFALTVLRNMKQVRKPCSLFYIYFRTISSNSGKCWSVPSALWATPNWFEKKIEIKVKTLCARSINKIAKNKRVLPHHQKTTEKIVGKQMYKNKNFALSLLIFKNKIRRPRYQFGVALEALRHFLRNHVCPENWVTGYLFQRWPSYSSI